MKTGSRTFTDEQEREIYRVYVGERLNQRKLADRFECSKSTIQRMFWRQGYKARNRSESRKGKLNPCWRGGRIICQGYILRFKPDHPHCNSYGYVREHRLIMEEYVGRQLLPAEVVHHKNKKLDDNQIENLMLFESGSDHQKWHHLKNRELKMEGSGETKMAVP